MSRWPELCWPEKSGPEKRDSLIADSVRRNYGMPDLGALQNRVTALARAHVAAPPGSTRSDSTRSDSVPSDSAGRSAGRWLLPAAIAFVAALTMCGSRFTPDAGLRSEGATVEQAALTSSLTEAAVVVGAAALGGRGLEMRRNRRNRLVRHQTRRARRRQK